MTNLALLARVHPQAFARIGRIVFMGGGVDISNATAAAEFNVFHDPEAAAMVLAACAEHDVPVTMYGLDVFYDPLVTDVQVDGLARARHPGRRTSPPASSRSTTAGSPTRGRRSATRARSASSSIRMPCAPSGCRCASSSPVPGRAAARSSTAATGVATSRTTRTGWRPRWSTSPSAVDGPRIADLWVRTVRGEAS